MKGIESKLKTVPLPFWLSASVIGLPRGTLIAVRDAKVNVALVFFRRHQLTK